RGKNWKEAGQFADKLLAIDRKDVEILKISAAAKNNDSADPENRFDAAAIYEEAVNLAPKDKELRYSLVEIYSNAKATRRRVRARELLLELISNVEQDPKAYLLLGHVYYLMGDTGNAEANFKKGFDLLPSPIPTFLAWAFTSYAGLLIDQKHYEEAR